MKTKESITTLLTIEQIAGSPDLLAPLSRKELELLWRHYYPRRLVPKTKALLIHDTSFFSQEKVIGATNHETQQLIKQAIIVAKKNNSTENSNNSNKTVTLKKTPRLTNGSTLIRRWHGIEHKVTFKDGAYMFQGESYKSLTKIAKLITGTHWSGPRFFGLHKTQSIKTNG